MKLLVDIPVILEEGGEVRNVTLREYIQEARKVKESSVGYLIHDVLDALFVHLMDVHELTQELAEIKIFKELREVFGSDIAEEVFKKSKENKEMEREFRAAVANGTLENFLRTKGALMITLEDENLDETLETIDELLNLSPEELKKKIGTGINDFPSNEGTSFN
jgi:dGTP triphosphohydrolase